MSNALRSLDGNLALVLVAGLILGFIAFHVKASRDAGLSHIPGPFLARYSNLHSWIEAQRWHGTDVCYLRRLHDQYGDVVRVSPRRVSVRDPDAIPIIYGMKASLDKVRRPVAMEAFGANSSSSTVGSYSGCPAAGKGPRQPFFRSRRQVSFDLAKNRRKCLRYQHHLAV